MRRSTTLPLNRCPDGCPRPANGLHAKPPVRRRKRGTATVSRPSTALATSRAALDAEAGIVASTPEPGRNVQLNESAYTLARFVASGQLSEHELTAVLIDAAARAGLPDADPPGIYASLQAGAGVLAGSGPYVRIGNIRHPLLIWPLLMGRTGSGRKGEATTVAEVFLRRAKLSTFPALTVAGLSSGEGLIEQVCDDGPRAEDRRLLVIETEFSSVMARSRREGNTLAAISRQAWEGRPLSVMNRKQLKASASHIAIIGHVAPREFRLRLADAELAGGTYNRYLPFYVERGKLLAVPEPVAEPVLARLAARLSDAIDTASAITSIQLGRAAISLWSDELYPEFADLDDEDDLAYSEFTRRAAPYCQRVAGLHAALDGRALIGKDDLTAASAQVRYSVASARYVLDGVRRNPREERLIRAINAAGQAGLTDPY